MTYEKQVIELLDTTNLTFRAIAKRIGCTEHTVSRHAKRYLNPTTYLIRTVTARKYPTGKEHHNYKAGRWVDERGYAVVLAPTWYTGSRKHKGAYVFEHVLNYCQAHNLTEPPHGFVIHHIDHDKTNNHPDNLIPMTPEAHRYLHHVQKA